jgi:hypothetical protein
MAVARHRLQLTRVFDLQNAWRRRFEGLCDMELPCVSDVAIRRQIRADVTV